MIKNNPLLNQILIVTVASIVSSIVIAELKKREILAIEDQPKTTWWPF